MRTQWGECHVVTLRETPGDYMADTSQGVAEYYREHIQGRPEFRPEQEGVWVLLLNTRFRVIGHTLVALGVLDQAIMHPREVFRAAIVGAAHSVVLVHNHPSGDVTPSDADIRETRRIREAGKILKIDVLDHLIMASNEPWKGPERIPADGPAHGAPRWASLRAMGYWAP